MKKYIFLLIILIFLTGILILPKKAFENLWDLISIFSSKLNIFQATVGPSPTLVPPDLPSDWQEDEVEEIGEKIEEVEEKVEIGSLPEFDLEQAQEILDDIAEKIDILSQKVAELVGEPEEGIGGPIEPIEEPIEPIEELEEEELVEEEELEDEKAAICFIEVNTASQEELQKITGVGPVIAQRIIEARPFSSIYDLIMVSGVGEITLQKIVEQDCAYVEYYAKGGGGGGGQSAQPKITFSYSENNPVNKEIEVTLSLADFKNALYDVKISIEKEDLVLSQIYNPKEAQWQSSYYYLKEVFSGKSFEGKFQLKIAEEKNDFRGEADIIVRIRENGETNYSEFSGKINITEPESELDTTPILEVSLQSLEFSIVEFTTPSQSQTFTISNGGEGSLEWQGIIEYTSPSDANWLEIEPDFGTAPSEVSVSLNQDAFSLDKGDYKAEIVIRAEGAGGSPKKIGVELEVKTKPEPEPEPKPKQLLLTVIINEIAWMGTKTNSADEWIEFYNPNLEPVEITGWQLLFYPSGNSEPRINTFSILDTTTPAVGGFSYFLLERTDDSAISDIEADYIFTGALNDDGGVLELKDGEGKLIDRVDCSGGQWFSGDKEKKISMERIDATASGSVPENWADNDPTISRQGLDAKGNLISGTPRAQNSAVK